MTGDADNRFSPGIETLLSEYVDRLDGKRIALVSHLAATDAAGRTSAQLLQDHPGVNLCSLMGPEHGFFGKGAAGEVCHSTQHPEWDIPVHSLYGDTRQPTPAMLEDIDTVIVDLQDLGFRPYTYVSTLKLVLEAASAANKDVIVADRPIPLPCTLDGPMLDPAFSSFVALVDTPMVYGMTPAETALWLTRNLNLPLSISVAEMQGYWCDSARGANWPLWVPPSPAIVSWHSAMCFPATVFCEALGAIDCGRNTATPFERIGAPWTDGDQLAEALTQCDLPGVNFHSSHYAPVPAEPHSLIHGVRIEVTRPHEFLPIRTSLSIIHAITSLYGPQHIWNSESTRDGWFDKLYGTDSVRLALARGESPQAIWEGWQEALDSFRDARYSYVLYEDTPTEQTEAPRGAYVPTTT